MSPPGRLTAAFPEISEAAQALGEDVVIDGEAVIHREGRLDFAALQQRTSRRPAAVARLAGREPAHLIAFDLLLHAGTTMLDWPYRERRAALESLFQGHGLAAPWALTPTTGDPDQARQWMTQWAAAGVEGIVAKGASQPYQPGRRGWQKYRRRETAEAIIGAVTGTLAHPQTLLLGRYTNEGEFRLVARSTPLPERLRGDGAELITPARAGHPWQEMRISSHWGSREPLAFTPVTPELVAEFFGDMAIDAGRWRHPVGVHRLRGDMTPEDVPLLETAWGTAPHKRPEAATQPAKEETMAKTPQRTVYRVTPAGERGDGNRWQVEHKEGRREEREPHRTQEEAISAARSQAKGHEPAQVIVHGRDGRIRTEYTYGNDPRRTPG
ncbi:DUF2188 domain-containing protein [Streptomyces sp. TRM68367]|uniref:ATP-dependent DNA ligase n=1 Tax=Streptomyces sp. TRM68367 TaxID=2758415 RepID=UPI0029349AD0|nr:DUF2188 domain-containing protein [Streptomyces sp. TRM68367]